MGQGRPSWSVVVLPGESCRRFDGKKEDFFDVCCSTYVDGGKRSNPRVATFALSLHDPCSGLGDRAHLSHVSHGYCLCVDVKWFESLSVLQFMSTAVLGRELIGKKL